MKNSLIYHAHKVQLLRLLGQSGSIGRAAREAGVIASAFSQSMSQLETLLGTTLIRRTREGASLTSRGRALVESLSPYLDGLQEHSPGQTRDQPIRQKLVIGAYDSIAITIFPRIFPALRKKHPYLRLNVITQRTHRLYASLREGEMDLAIVIESEDSNNFDTTRVAQERLGLYVARHHEIRKQPWPETLEKYGLATISPGPQGYPRYYQRFLKAFGPIPTVVATDSFETVRYLTLSGSVVGILPTNVVSRSSEDLVEITAAALGKEKKIPDSTHYFALVSRRNLAPRIRELLLSEIREGLKK